MKAVRGAVGSLKHEGMQLTPEEMKLLEAYVSGRITEKEYDNRALELALGATGGHENGKVQEEVLRK